MSDALDDPPTGTPSRSEPGALAESIRWQAAACESLGAPFTAALLRHAAADADRGGVVAEALAALTSAPRDAAVALRLAGALHRLVLEGSAADLASHYPSVGGDGDADAAWPPARATIAGHLERVREIVTRPPQTNEVGRAAALLGVLAHLVRARDLPVRLTEIGTSAGLSLRADRFCVTAGGRAVYGSPDSSVVLAEGWRGELPPEIGHIKVNARRGCDVAPVDPATDDGALTLMSYVWPEQADRLTRLRGAIRLAREVPADLIRQPARDFVRLLQPRTGEWLVIWHSVMWQYLAADERRAVTRAIDAIGAAASIVAPVAHVALEPRTGPHGPFLVTVRTWPEVGLGSGEVVLGIAAPHGVPVEWHQRSNAREEISPS